jgi:hypothetical protein
VAYNSELILRGNVTMWIEERVLNQMTALARPRSVRIA